MSKRILINHPGDGAWIMARVGGTFVPSWDHSLANHDDRGILGGFVFNTFLGNAIFVHNAGETKTWCSRELLWMVFDYAFRQLSVGKVLAPVAANNQHALALNLRAGFVVETKLVDAVAPGVDLLLLSMVPQSCRWLKLRPTNYYSRVNRGPVDG